MATTITEVVLKLALMGLALTFVTAASADLQQVRDARYFSQILARLDAIEKQLADKSVTSELTSSTDTPDNRLAQLTELLRIVDHITNKD